MLDLGRFAMLGGLASASVQRNLVAISSEILMMDEPRLATDRLVLRQWSESDVEPYGRMLADPGTARFIVPGGEPVKPARAWEHAALMAGHWALHGLGMFVVEDRTTGQFLGRVGVWSPPGWFGLEVGWGIVPQARGQGIAFEASVAAMTWTFDRTGADEIVHCIDEENIRSQGLARRLGSRESEAISLWGRPARIWVSSRERFSALEL